MEILEISVNYLRVFTYKIHHTRGLYGAFFRAVASRDPINRLAYGGAILVPMAVPCFCRKNCPSNSKLLFCKMMLTRSVAYGFCRWALCTVFC